MCDVLQPPGINPTAVKYIYHIISHGIMENVGLLHILRRSISYSAKHYNRKKQHFKHICTKSLVYMSSPPLAYFFSNAMLRFIKPMTAGMCLGWRSGYGTTSRKVPESIPDGVTGDFSMTSDNSMCPGSTRPLKNDYQDTAGG
jgi:hypothetical protein